MNKLNKKTDLVTIEEELKCSYLNYAMSVIIGRALPDVRDGLKPVHRRILFAMYKLKNFWDNPYKKSARIVGNVIGKYHPHGDSAVYDTLVRMAQSFSLRYILVDGQGNFGSIDGDSAAAMRYTEVRMSRIAHELLSDLEKNTVDHVLNYDGTEKIPSVLPTRIPNILINGSSGIAVGMATNIPPHNLSEVIDGCIAYINNEKISVEQLMKYIPGPDFPTAAIINNREGIEKAYKTGRGKIFIRARTEIKNANKSNPTTIIVHEIPYQVNKAKLIEKISNLIKEKKIEGISELRDESDQEGTRIIIEIKTGAMVEVVLNNLYSLTPLQVSFGINMVALQNNKPKTFSLKEIIAAFVNHRREIITRRTIFELEKSFDRISTLEAFLVGIEKIDSIIQMIKKEATIEDAKIALTNHPWNLRSDNTILTHQDEKRRFHEFYKIDQNIKGDLYYLDEKQSQAILDLKLQRLTNLEKEKLVEEYKKILIESKKLIKILDDPNRLMEIIRKELLSIKKQYSDNRKTKIVSNFSDIKFVDLIDQKHVVVTLSYYGYIKYQLLDDYNAQKRGGKGKLAANIKEEDFIHKLLIANTHDTVLMFSNLGRIYQMKVYQLPKSGRGSRGKPIVNLLPLQKDERITTILPIGKRKKRNVSVFMASSNGMVKKTAISAFDNLRNTGIIAVNLSHGDEIIGADLTEGNDEIMLFSSFGKVVRFSENQVRNIGRATSGVKGILLQRGDKVVSLIVPRGNGTILTVTKNGYGKRTNQDAFPIKSRATKGVISIKINDRNGEVVGSVQVKESDQIAIITSSGVLVRTRVSEMNRVGRNTKGVMLIRTRRNERVVGIQRIIKSSENNDIYIPNTV